MRNDPKALWGMSDGSFWADDEADRFFEQIFGECSPIDFDELRRVYGRGKFERVFKEFRTITSQ